MRVQLKNMNRRASIAVLPMLGSLVLVGCASSGQDRREVPHWTLDAPQPHHEQQTLMTHSGDSSAVLFAPGAQAGGSEYAYERDLAPEYNRRDGALAVGEPDPTAGWYAWPEQQRPSLDDQGRFYTSSNPNVYVYPGGEDHRYNHVYGRRYRHFHRRDYGRRGYPYLRNRVR